MDERQTQLRKGVLELAVLSLVSVQPRYGGELVDELGQRPGLDAAAGTVYPVLTRLSAGGLLETSWRESPSGPPRKYYGLTTRGYSALEARLADWLQLVGTMSDLVADTNVDRLAPADVTYPLTPIEVSQPNPGDYR